MKRNKNCFTLHCFVQYPANEMFSISNNAPINAKSLGEEEEAENGWETFDHSSELSNKSSTMFSDSFDHP